MVDGYEAAEETATETETEMTGVAPEMSWRLLEAPMRHEDLTHVPCT